jgi:hypothetical protein
MKAIEREQERRLKRRREGRKPNFRVLFERMKELHGG